MKLFPDSWSAVFALQMPLFELIARGTVLYLGIVIMLRLMPRRSGGGELAVMDLVFALLIADAAAHALGNYTSVADGIILIAIIMGWNYLINALSHRFPFFERLVSSPPLQIIRDGELIRRNLRREFLTEVEVMSHLREQGIEDLNEVKAAYVEGEGKITVTKKRER